MKEEIEKCIKVLKDGGVILYPTDTIWGLGCDATNPAAIEKIYRIKKRSESKSLITVVSSEGMLQRYINEVPDLAWDILDLASKPTTIIYDNPTGIASNAIAQDNTVGIRLINDGFANKLVHRYNKPIISTSANISGATSPTSFESISEEVKNQVDFIVDAKFDEGGQTASSIIKLAVDGTVQVLRK